MKKEEIEKRYSELISDVKTNEFYTKIDLTNRVNCYTCTKCRRTTKTKDIDAGVTPFIIGCSHCGAEATSSMYHDNAPSLKPTQEWYRPELKELLDGSRSEAALDHVLSGGLELREV